MFDFTEFSQIPFQIIHKVVFSKKKFTIHFVSGNALQAKPPDDITFNQFKQACEKNLSSDRIIYED